MLAAAALAGPTAAQQSSVETPGIGPDPALPKPDLTASAENFSRIIGWPDGRAPTAPAGFTVTAFARKLDSPRWLYVLPNGDVLVAEARTLPKSEQPASMRQRMVTSGSVGVSQNRIVLLRDGQCRRGLARRRRPCQGKYSSAGAHRFRPGVVRHTVAPGSTIPRQCTRSRTTHHW